MDIRALQNSIVVPPPVEEPIDPKYVSALACIIKLHVVGYAERNLTKRVWWWADYLIPVGWKKPTYEELKAVKQSLKLQFSNMKISVETVYFRVKGLGKLIPKWNRLTFSW